MFDKDEFKRKYYALGIKSEALFDPFPFEKKIEESTNEEPSNCSFTYRLYNGMLVRLGNRDKNNCILSMNATLLFLQSQQRKNDWNKLIKYLESQCGRRLTTEIGYTPDDKYIKYNKDIHDQIEYVFNYFNVLANNEYGLPDYPDNWFEVMEILISYKRTSVGLGGDEIACYCFASPRQYFKYFKAGLTNNQIAEDIYYDNL